MVLEFLSSNTEQSLCKPLLFSQSTTMRVFFPLNASRLVFAMPYHATRLQQIVPETKVYYAFSSAHFF